MAKATAQKAKAPAPDAPTRTGYEVKVRIDRVVDYENSRVKAIASANVGPFAVHGIRVIEGQKGIFVQMPQNSYKKDGQTQYHRRRHSLRSWAGRTRICLTLARRCNHAEEREGVCKRTDSLVFLIPQQKGQI